MATTMRDLVLRIKSQGVEATAGDLAKFGLAMGGIRAGLDLILGAAKAVIVPIVKFTKHMWDLAKVSGVQEAAERSLAVALHTVGQNAVEAMPGLREYASGLQDITGYGDELILSSQKLLVSVGGLSGKGLERATEAALDLASAQGISVRTSFDLVAKAATGYTGTLSRYGLILDKNLKESEKFGAALDKIEAAFGGAAAGNLDTFNGRLGEMHGRIGDLKEALGEPFKEVFKRLMGGGISPLIKSLGNFISESKGVKIAAANLGLVFISVAEAAEIMFRAMTPSDDPASFWGDQLDSINQGLLGFAAGIGSETAALALYEKQADGSIKKIAAYAAGLAKIQLPSMAEGVDYVKLAENVGIMNGTIEATGEKWESARIGLLKYIEAVKAGNEETLTEEGLTGVSAGVELNPESVIAAAKEMTFDPIPIDSLIPLDTESLVESLGEQSAIYSEHLINLADQSLSNKIGIIEAERTLAEMAGESTLEYELSLLEIRKEQELESAEENAALKYEIEEKYRLMKLAAEKDAAGKEDAINKAKEKNKQQMAMQTANAVIGTLSAVFGENKALAYASALVDTWAAADAALMQGGGVPWGVPPMLATIAMGMQNVRAISSQQKPGFAFGGIVQGMGTPFDSTMVGARPGEAILPPQLTNFLLNAAGGAGGAGNELVLTLEGDAWAAVADSLSAEVRKGSIVLEASEVRGSRSTR